MHGISLLILFLRLILSSLIVLLRVAFFTLFERKLIGLIHSRVGPNKVSFIGILQPILDALKLLTKVKFTPTEANYLSYNLSPHLSLILALIIWAILPGFLGDSNYSLLLFLAIGSALVVPVLIAGWASNSKYSLLGSLRSVAQSISYEAVLTTLLIIVTCIGLAYSVSRLRSFSSVLWLPVSVLWLFCVLAETHRAPFDFAESERELVSGFNTEYGGAYFAFIFLSEYRVLLVSTWVVSYLFLGWLFGVASWAGFLVKSFSRILILSITIWIRVTYVRFRYDLLIIAAWKSLLPISLSMLALGLFI